MHELPRTNAPPELMKKFARFFRGYMGTAPIVAAALPIPVTAGRIIPTYAEHTSFLTAYSSMFCFLAVAFVFYRRHRLGTYLLPELWEKKRSRIVGRFSVSWLPLILIFLTAASAIAYHVALTTALQVQFDKSVPFADRLKTGSIGTFPFWFQASFFASYLGIFVFSTLAFALMAVREYMQTKLGLSEHALVLKSGDPNAKQPPQRSRH